MAAPAAEEGRRLRRRRRRRRLRRRRRRWRLRRRRRRWRLRRRRVGRRWHRRWAAVGSWAGTAAVGNSGDTEADSSGGKAADSSGGTEADSWAGTEADRRVTRRRTVRLARRRAERVARRRTVRVTRRRTERVTRRVAARVARLRVGPVAVEDRGPANGVAQGRCPDLEELEEEGLIALAAPVLERLHADRGAPATRAEGPRTCHLFVVTAAPSAAVLGEEVDGDPPGGGLGQAKLELGGVALEHRVVVHRQAWAGDDAAECGGCVGGGRSPADLADGGVRGRRRERGRGQLATPEAMRPATSSAPSRGRPPRRPPGDLSNVLPRLRTVLSMTAFTISFPNGLFFVVRLTIRRHMGARPNRARPIGPARLGPPDWARPKGPARRGHRPT